MGTGVRNTKLQRGTTILDPATTKQTTTSSTTRLQGRRSQPCRPTGLRPSCLGARQEAQDPRSPELSNRCFERPEWSFLISRPVHFEFMAQGPCWIAARHSEVLCAVRIEAEVVPPSCWPPPLLDCSSSEAHGICLETLVGHCGPPLNAARTFIHLGSTWSLSRCFCQLVQLVPLSGHDSFAPASRLAIRGSKFCTPFHLHAVHPTMNFRLSSLQFGEATFAPPERGSAARSSTTPLSCRELPHVAAPSDGVVHSSGLV